MDAVINLEEAIGKTVGARRIKDAFAAGMGLQKSGNQLMRHLGGFPVRRGVYRFDTHEKAHEWMMQAIVQATRN